MLSNLESDFLIELLDLALYTQVVSGKKRSRIKKTLLVVDLLASDWLLDAFSIIGLHESLIPQCVTGNRSVLE